MALAITGSVSNGRADASATLTFAHTSTSDPLLVSVVDWQKTLTGVTFNGTALTKGGEYFLGPDWRISWWFLTAPGTVTANVVVTLSAAEGSSAGAMNVQNWAPAYTETKFASLATVTSYSAQAVVSDTGHLVIDLFVDWHTNQTYAVGGSQTKLWGQDSVASAVVKSAGSSAPGGSSVTMSWTTTVTPTGAHVVLDLQDAPTGGAAEHAYPL